MFGEIKYFLQGVKGSQKGKHFQIVSASILIMKIWLNSKFVEGEEG